jgi:hypothetical protein
VVATRLSADLREVSGDRAVVTVQTAVVGVGQCAGSTTVGPVFGTTVSWPETVARGHRMVTAPGGPVRLQLIPDSAEECTPGSGTQVHANRL